MKIENLDFAIVVCHANQIAVCTQICLVQVTVVRRLYDSEQFVLSQVPEGESSVLAAADECVLQVVVGHAENAHVDLVVLRRLCELLHLAQRDAARQTPHYYCPV